MIHRVSLPGYWNAHRLAIIIGGVMSAFVGGILLASPYTSKQGTTVPYDVILIASTLVFLAGYLGMWVHIHHTFRGRTDRQQFLPDFDLEIAWTDLNYVRAKLLENGYEQIDPDNTNRFRRTSAQTFVDGVQVNHSHNITAEIVKRDSGMVVRFVSGRKVVDLRQWAYFAAMEFNEKVMLK